MSVNSRPAWPSEQVSGHTEKNSPEKLKRNGEGGEGRWGGEGGIREEGEEEENHFLIWQMVSV